MSESEFRLWGLDPNNPEHRRRLEIANEHQTDPTGGWVTARLQPSLTFEDPLDGLPFAQVQRCIMECPTLSLGARVLYFLLRIHARQEDQCFPGQESLGRRLGCTSRQVHRYLSELVAFDLIRSERRGLGQTNRYFLRRLTERHVARLTEPLTSVDDRTQMSDQDQTPESD